MLISYIGRKDHSVMFDKEYIFLGSANNINNQFESYEIPDNIGRYLCHHYPEDVNKANITGMIFKEVKKK